MEYITEKKVNEWFDKVEPTSNYMVDNLKSLLNRIAKLQMPVELLEVVVDQVELDEVDVYAILRLPGGNRIGLEHDGHKILVRLWVEELLYPALEFRCCYTEDLALDKVRTLVEGTLGK